MTLRPDLTVAAIVERDGQFLLVEERVANRMVFNQPAGHVEKGEQFIDAVVRETLEETAWTSIPKRSSASTSGSSRTSPAAFCARRSAVGSALTIRRAASIAASSAPCG
jgi:8-oxo-dGTP pyrophosphatase MutT (NUDIX family)